MNDKELLSEEELTRRVERRKREKAVNFARANVGLSGFESDEFTEELCQRYIEGEITIQEMINEIDKMVESVQEHGCKREGVRPLRYGETGTDNKLFNILLKILHCRRRLKGASE